MGEVMRVLVIGVTGMLGHTVFRELDKSVGIEAWGTMRSPTNSNCIASSCGDRLLTGIDVLEHDSLVNAFQQVRPDAVINCVGVIKQKNAADDPVTVLPLNSIFPHRLARLCEQATARLIHISTDCVYTGQQGMYTEGQAPDARDLYGLSKFLGEVTGHDYAVTLRTSIIGHELESRLSLVDWFLGQSGSVRGYKNAIFSGLPTVELANVIRDFILPSPELKGLYHVSAEPIDKLSLLTIVATEYGKTIEILPDEEVCIDRSLDSSRFRETTGYNPPQWPRLIKLMHENIL